MISVALCTFNGEKFVAQQLESILSQHLPVDEIVVCDDGSTDHTWEILTNFQNRYPKIFRIFRNEQTLQVIRNFEKAINLCTKDIIILSDQDDLWLPEKTENIKSYFDENPSMDALCHDLLLMKDETILDFTNWYTLNFDPDELNHMSLIDRLLFRGNIVTGAGFSFRKRNEPVRFDKASSKFLHDRQLGLYFALEEKLGIIRKPLAIYRLHDGQQIGTDFSIRAAKQKEFSKFDHAGPRLRINFYNAALEYWNQDFQFSSQEKINRIILHKLKQQRDYYFSQLPFFKRKYVQLVWWWNNRYGFRWKDFFS